MTLRRLTLAAAVLLGCLSVIFVAAMGAAFWVGTLWASQAWIAGG